MLYVSLALALCLQDDPSRIAQSKVGTKWVYTNRDTIQGREVVSEVTVTESRADGAVIETRLFDAGKEVGREKVQTWSVKDGFLVLDSIRVYKMESKKGDQWTYRSQGVEVTSIHEGIDEIRVPAGLYRDAIHIRHKGPLGDIHQWIVPAVGVVKTSVPLGGNKGNVIQELKEFIPVGPAKPAPRPIKAFTKSIDPWERQEPDSWYRYKIAAGDKDIFDDVGLKSKDDSGSTLLAQKPNTPVTESISKRIQVRVVSQETLRIQSRTFLCEIRSPIDEGGAVIETNREWAVKEGKHAGAVLKAESPGRSFLANKAWDSMMRIKGREFECLVIEAESKSGDQTTSTKTWFCSSLPRPVKFESGETESTLVDFGTGWSKRPAYPGEK